MHIMANHQYECKAPRILSQINCGFFFPPKLEKVQTVRNIITTLKIYEVVVILMLNFYLCKPY